MEPYFVVALNYVKITCSQCLYIHFLLIKVVIWIYRSLKIIDCTIANLPCIHMLSQEIN